MCYQIETNEGDRDKTEFICSHGLERVMRKSIKLKLAQTTFQRSTDVTLASVGCTSPLVYFKDIAVYFKSPVDHVVPVWHVWLLLYEANVRLKLHRCKCFAETIDYQLHAVRLGRFELAEDMTDTVEKEEHPTTHTEPRSPLGLCNVFGQIISNFSRLAALFTTNLRKDQLK